VSRVNDLILSARSPVPFQPDMTENSRLPFYKSIAPPLWGWIDRVRVSRKIGFGYAIAVGIAVVGTGIGVAIGEYYQRQAWATKEHARQELELLHRLQTYVLQTRTHQQQLIPLLGDNDAFREEYASLQNYAASVDRTWERLREFIESVNLNDKVHAVAIPRFLYLYRRVPNNYIERLEDTLALVDAGNLDTPEDVASARSVLLAFTNSALAKRFDRISDDLSELVALSEAENLEADLAVMAADRLRLWIIVISALLSVAIAFTLAAYTTRAIAQPLEAVTQAARKASREEDFSLRAPVASGDEIGLLAESFNELLARIEVLLVERQAAAAQQLLQSEKMSSLGQMMAGVAHEINNPVNFIYGNLSHLQEYTEEILELVEVYRQEIPDPPDSVIDKAEEIDIDFLAEDLNKLLDSMKLGAERTRSIVLSLRNFSRLEEDTPHPVDINESLESTLTLLRNRTKQGIAVDRNYGDIPSVEGYSGSLYQVFMNLLANAMDAVEERRDREANFSPQIAIVTETLEDWLGDGEISPQKAVAIRITDNGGGISPEHQARIFDTFFTTKPVGVGTGLGLAIGREIVEDKHGGQLSFTSELGRGTEFSVILPVTRSSVQPAPSRPAQLIG